MKICSRCKENKSISEFSRKRKDDPKLRSECKVCNKITSLEYRNNNSEKEAARAKRYVEENKESVTKYRISWVSENKDKCCAYSKLWRTNNPEKSRAVTKKYKENNRDKQRQYRFANKESIKEKRAARISLNPEQSRRYYHNYVARKKANGGVISKGRSNELFILQKGKCACCHVKLDSSNTHMDHIMPIALEGKNNDMNIQLLCMSCNLQKHAKHPIDFMQSRGFLL